MIDFLNYTFIQHAVLAGVSLSLLAGLLGPFVVASKQSVTSDILAHVALAGIGIAAFFAIEPLWGALVVLFLGSVLLWHMVASEQYAIDALSMLFLSSGLAVALAFIHAARNTNVVLDQYLFGSILTVTTPELMSMVSLSIVTICIVWWFWYPLVGAVHMPAYRIPYAQAPYLMQLLFFILLAGAVWVGIKTVGGLLVGALLVIPSLIMRPHVTSFFSLTIGTILLSLTGTLAGLFLSLFIDIPPSSVIILVLVSLFIASRVLNSIRRVVH